MAVEVTGLAATLERFGIKPVRFAEMIGKDARTVRRWCRDGAPIEVRALLLACERSWPQEPRRKAVYAPGRFWRRLRGQR